jgi:DHA1 family bicyclomycin/chloramphenicol resistance-like MFS transporter
MTSMDPFHEPATETIGKAVAPPRLITLILLSALAVLPVNMILPSLPNIAATFQADFALVNLSVAGFAIVTALIEAIGGAISDRFGRRPVVLISLSIFIAASIGCVLAPNIAVFLFFRAMQACIAPCYSVALVVIKESSDEGEAASKFGYLAMGWALAPMVGPLFGGSLDELFGWRSSFVVFAILGAAAFTLSVRELKAIPQPRSKNRYLTSYIQLLGSARFWAYTLCMACSMGVLYIFLGGAPLVVGNALGGSPLHGSGAVRIYPGQLPCWPVRVAEIAGDRPHLCASRHLYRIAGRFDPRDAGCDTRSRVLRPMHVHWNRQRADHAGSK